MLSCSAACLYTRHTAFLLTLDGRDLCVCNQGLVREEVRHAAQRKCVKTLLQILCLNETKHVLASSLYCRVPEGLSHSLLHASLGFSTVSSRLYGEIGMF